MQWTPFNEQSSAITEVDDACVIMPFMVYLITPWGFFLFYSESSQRRT